MAASCFLALYTFFLKRTINQIKSTSIEKDHLGDWSPEKDSNPSQDSNHPDDVFQSRYVTPGFKPFSQVKSVP